jgi:hypothetical protein
MKSILDVNEHVVPRLRSVIDSVAAEIVPNNPSVSYRVHASVAPPYRCTLIGTFLKLEPSTQAMREEILYFVGCHWASAWFDCWVSLGGEAPGDLDWDDTTGPRSRIDVSQTPDKVSAALDAWVLSATEFIMKHRNAVVSHLASDETQAS